MRHSFLVLTLVALPACAGSRGREPTAEELEQVCRQIRCRPPTTLRIPVDEQHVYAVDWPASPWIAGPGLISLLPGETITFTGTVDADGRLQNLEVVDNQDEPAPNTIILRFAAPKLGQTMLHVDNHFDEVLTYEMAMMLPMDDHFYATSAVPVHPGVTSTELWWDPIVQLALTNFRLQAEQP